MIFSDISIFKFQISMVKTYGPSFDPLKKNSHMYSILKMTLKFCNNFYLQYYRWEENKGNQEGCMIQYKKGSRLFVTKINAERSPLHCWFHFARRQLFFYSFITSQISSPTVMLTKSLIVLIFHFGSGFFFTTKNSPQSVWKSNRRFSKRIWMKQAAYHFRRDYDLHASTSNSLFVVSRQNLALS